MVAPYIEASSNFATVMDFISYLMLHKDPLYLDHAATTPVVVAAQVAMAQAVQHWANPSSPHRAGRRARAALEDARKRIGAALNWDGEIIFTSGASEAIAIALSGTDARASAVEHDAVLAVARGERIPVDDGGFVDPKAFNRSARYAVQSVNNETGVIQPAADILSAIRAVDGIYFADCSQSAGKLPLPDADMICVSAHKLGGPPGIGALLVRDLSLLTPSGGQEQGYRRGTENLPAVMGFAAALEVGYDWMTQVAGLRHKLDNAIIGAGGAVVAQNSPRLPTLSSYHMPGVSASTQLIGFDMAGIAVSAGSACSSGTLKTSHVLGAMGWDSTAAGQVVRVSLGATTTAQDIDRFVANWIAIANRAKSR